ncbi:MAG: sigma-70 family RNA polymerase sigma factor [Candidatus Levybacteria bacterium]|nr:sigma-70 family RNA polymerase sigma factor [Candidatus Levybacteria bacterium]
MVERRGVSLLDIKPASYGAGFTPDLKVSTLSPAKDYKVVEAPTFEELFSTLREARLARQTLVNRKRLPSWETLDPEEKRKVEEILGNSEEIRGHIKLPGRLPTLRINRTGELIESGKQARSLIFQRLRDFIQPQLDEEFGEHARDLRWEVENAIKQVIVSGRIDDERELQSALKDQFGVTGEAKIREVKSVMTGEEIKKYEKNVQRHIARLRDRLVRRGCDLEDAAQEARLAVLEAINNYNPELGKFPPYLFSIINGRLHDLMRTTSPMSRSEQRNLKIISEFEEKFESEKGRQPTIEETEVATGLKREVIQDIKEFPRVFTQADLGGEVIEIMEREGHEGLRDLDDTAEPEEFLAMKEEILADNERATVAFEFIPDREKQIIYRHDFEGKPHHEIGRELGLSESRTVQLRKRAIKRLKKMLSIGISLKEFLGELGITYSFFQVNNLGEGLNISRGRKGARLGPVEMRIIKKRVEAHKQQVVENREARRRQIERRTKTEKRKKRREKELRRNVKERLRKRSFDPERVNGHRPKEYRPVKPEDLEVLLELYGDQLKGREVRVLRLRSGLEDGVLWTREEVAIVIGLKTSAGVVYIENRGLGKLRQLEPSIFEQETPK